jgi:hypothetical protein
VKRATFKLRDVHVVQLYVDPDREAANQRAAQHSWRLCRQYRSMSLPFVVILRFEGERLTMLNLSLPYYGTSWADYSEDRAATRGKP